MKSDNAGMTPMRQDVRRLYERLGIVPRLSLDHFLCEHKHDCCRGYANWKHGAWPYVGDHYGLAEINDKPAKILFVAMNLGGREEKQHESLQFAQDGFRGAAEDRSNPHMSGVSMILEHLLDNKDPKVYLRQFALTNLVKCTPITGSMTSAASGIRERNCRGFLQRELDLLRPDVIITQGVGPRSALSLLCPPSRGDDVIQKERVSLWSFDPRWIMTTPHPARLRGLRWCGGTMPRCFYDVIDLLRHKYTLGARASSRGRFKGAP